MTLQEATQAQVLLEGVPLPAKKQALVEYARGQDARVAETLRSLPDREYRSLDEVGEQLASVQPSWPQPDAELPRDESGQPPGGDAYLDPHAESGAVRPSAPASNPPEKALQKQTKAQKQQALRQEQVGTGKADTAS
jgi:Protein of unknown function (DUF2795)